MDDEAAEVTNTTYLLVTKIFTLNSYGFQDIVTHVIGTFNMTFEVRGVIIICKLLLLLVKLTLLDIFNFKNLLFYIYEIDNMMNSETDMISEPHD